MGSGTVEGMLAELLSAGLNVNAGGFDIPATHVELQVLAWCRTLFGFPADSGAAIVSGGSMANFVALAAARDAAAGSAAEQGLRTLAAPLAFYCSDQTHNSVSKALRLLGLGREALRSVPSNAAFELDLTALDRMIAEDRARGVRPWARAPLTISRRWPGWQSGRRCGSTSMERSEPSRCSPRRSGRS
jgi:glutamate/tyrosine decarboxylase-like PLP-dependent enzyme